MKAQILKFKILKIKGVICLFFLLITSFYSCTFKTLEARRNKIYKQVPAPVVSGKSDYSDSVIVLIAGPKYNATFLRNWLLGAHYRKAWCAPVSVPLIDITKEAGGLKPIRTGGNKQTRTLNLEDSSGKIYVLRSIQKSHDKMIPLIFRRTVLIHFAQDQVSTMHPYGAFVIPPLAKAVNVFHTNPKLVFIPHDINLGEYYNSFSGMLALFEEKPQGNHSNDYKLNYSKKIINTETLDSILQNNNNTKVDQRNFLRARLLDMLIGDWDRSGDQWVWAEFNVENKIIYKPVPRDRDQAFVKMDGLFPWLGNKKFLLRKIQGFKNEITDIKGLNKNARELDKKYLNELTLNDWISVADSMKSELTDEVIKTAISSWPDTIYKLNGEEVIRKLINRRNKLAEYAAEYYFILSKNVEINSTNAKEVIEISDSEKGIKVQMFDEAKQNLLYSRSFIPTETKTVLINGIGGNDHINLSTKFLKPKIKFVKLD